MQICVPKRMLFGLFSAKLIASSLAVLFTRDAETPFRRAPEATQIGVKHSDKIRCRHFARVRHGEIQLRHNHRVPAPLAVVKQMLHYRLQRCEQIRKLSAKPRWPTRFAVATTARIRLEKPVTFASRTIQATANPSTKNEPLCFTKESVTLPHFHSLLKTVGSSSERICQRL
jgi:hypothetical protein